MTIDQVEQFLLDLQENLDQLLEVQRAKRRALASLDTALLEQLSETEGLLTRRMAQFSHQRGQLSDELAAGNPPFRSLREYVTASGGPRRDRLLQLLDQAREDARRVKQQASVNWMAIYRTNEHVLQMLAIIAQAGRPTTGSVARGGGLLLDQTA